MGIVASLAGLVAVVAIDSVRFVLLVLFRRKLMYANGHPNVGCLCFITYTAYKRRCFQCLRQAENCQRRSVLRIGKVQICRHAPSSLVAMKSLASGKHMNFAPAPAALRMTLRQTERFLATLFFEQICATAAKVAGMAKLVGVSSGVT